MTCFWIHQNHQILWYPLIMLPFDQMNLKTLLLYSSCRGKKKRQLFQQVVSGCPPHWCEVQWVKKFLLEGLGSIKWCQSQVQPHISRNWNLMRLHGEKTVLMLIPFLLPPSAKLVSHANFHGSILITSSILIEKESELIEFFRTVGNFLVFTFLGLMQCEQLLSLSQRMNTLDSFFLFSFFSYFFLCSFFASFFSLSFSAVYFKLVVF